MGGNNGSTLKDVWYSSNGKASRWTQASNSETKWSAGSGSRLTLLTGNYGLLAEMKVAEHLTHGAPVMVVLGQKSRLKTMKLQEAELEVW